MHCFHRWPFLFLVRIKDACKLYCRASASSAYYLLKDKVVDGTKCGPDTFDMCVNGICQVSADYIHVVIPVFYLFNHTTLTVCYRKVDANSYDDIQDCYSKTCLIQNLCNLFPWVIRHWFSFPFDHFLYVFCTVYSDTLYILTQTFFPYCVWD